MTCSNSPRIYGDRLLLEQAGVEPEKDNCRGHLEGGGAFEGDRQARHGLDTVEVVDRRKV